MQRTASGNGDGTSKVQAAGAPEARKRGRWDQTVDEQFVPAKKPSAAAGAATPQSWADVEVTLQCFGVLVMCHVLDCVIIQSIIDILLSTKKTYAEDWNNNSIHE